MKPWLRCDQSWLYLGLLLALAACASPAGMPAAPTAAPAPTADQTGLQFYEFYSPL